MSYDQWATASPYDDEIDWVEAAEKALKDQSPIVNPFLRTTDVEGLEFIINGLVEYIENDGEDSLAREANKIAHPWLARRLSCSCHDCLSLDMKHGRETIGALLEVYDKV